MLERNYIWTEAVDQGFVIYFVEHHKLIGWRSFVEHVWVKLENYVVLSEERALLEGVHVSVVDIIGNYFSRLDHVKRFKQVVWLDYHRRSLMDLTIKCWEYLIDYLLVNYLMWVIDIVIKEKRREQHHLLLNHKIKELILQIWVQVLKKLMLSEVQIAKIVHDANARFHFVKLV